MLHLPRESEEQIKISARDKALMKSVINRKDKIQLEALEIAWLLFLMFKVMMTSEKKVEIMGTCIVNYGERHSLVKDKLTLSIVK